MFGRILHNTCRGWKNNAVLRILHLPIKARLKPVIPSKNEKKNYEQVQAEVLFRQTSRYCCCMFYLGRIFSAHSQYTVSKFHRLNIQLFMFWFMLLIQKLRNWYQLSPSDIWLFFRRLIKLACSNKRMDLSWLTSTFRSAQPFKNSSILLMQSASFLGSRQY